MTREVPPQPPFSIVAPFYDLLMSAVPYRRWVDYVEEMLARLRLRPELTLDLACGTGKVGEELRRRGYETVGADIAEPMVRVAKRHERMPVCVMDARWLGFRPVFDLVVCLYDSLNYITDSAAFRQALASVHAVLRPGGAFIFDLNTRRALALNLFTQDNLDSLGPLRYDWRSSYDPETKLCTVDMWYEWDDGHEVRQLREVHHQRAYETREVRRWLRETGFGDARAYAYLSFRPPHRWTTRAYYVGRKGGGP